MRRADGSPEFAMPLIADVLWHSSETTLCARSCHRGGSHPTFASTNSLISLVPMLDPKLVG